MIVKNEDEWVWYALQSVLPYADQILVTDTGSSDHTVELIKSIASAKIKFSQIHVSSAAEVTAARASQLEATKTDWLWIVDGDEVYTETGAKEIKSVITQSVHNGIAVRRFDLLGDVYHRQVESVGEYRMLGTSGHLVTRLIRRSAFPGLKLDRPYPLEAYVDQKGRVIHSYDENKWYVTTNHLYHAMYLRRSSLGGNLPMLNRSKYRVESGLSIHDELPSVFTLARPSFLPDPLTHRSAQYELAASIITPVKNFKRKYL
jgi:glycosyltransferase involved in cell wall biosynthesis